MKKTLISILFWLLFTQTIMAGDWPQFRGNPARSGYTPETIPADLSLRWVFKPSHPPQPAWPGKDTRMLFDYAYHTVIVDGLVFFGSSVDGKVYALDAGTGAVRWTFFTGGPIRFTPAAWKDRIFVVSDDGFLYCLTIKTGKLLWKLPGGPDTSMVLGNDHMISRWPARGAPVILDNTVYFAAGIWPSEEIFLYALDPATGQVIWVNDSSGRLVMEQPHGGNRARSGISAQGYLAADKERILVPTGRSVPAVFNRSDGKLLHFHLAANQWNGGSNIMVAGDLFFNGGCAFDMQSGAQYQWIIKRRPRPSAPVAPPNTTVAFPGGLVNWDNGKVRAFRWAEVQKKDPKGQTVPTRALKEIWSISSPYGGTSLVRAGKTLASGGKGPGGYGVCVVDINSKKTVWSSKVDGPPYGLSVADESLYVSTNKGTIYCFGSLDSRNASIIEPPPLAFPYGDNKIYARVADEIVGITGITKGYCLDLACDDGALAYALARCTDLHIYAVEKDPEKVALARKKLDAAGLYGLRVTVHHGDPTKTAYPNYFANLIVSGRSVTEGPDDSAAAELWRLLRPYGGTACIGRPGAMKMTIRGQLADAGQWTHQYANAAGTLCSDDHIVKGPLNMLWFTDFNFQMPSRHGRGPSPLCKNGILVIEGLHGLLAVDAYNGHRLWKFPFPDILKPYDQEHLLGTAGTNSNMCMAGNSVFLRTDSRCLKINLATGKKQKVYDMPGQAGGNVGVWGYIAYADGTLFGSLSNQKHIVRHLYGGPRQDMSRLLTESIEIFALDADTGEHKWTYRAQFSIRHNTIVIGKGRLYLIDRPVETQDLLTKKQTEKDKAEGENPSTSRLFCLEAETGKILWEQSEGIYGTMLALSTQYEVLVMGYQYSQRSFQLPSEKGNRLTGFRVSDGKRLWDAGDKYISRPIINGRTIYAQPYAYDLLTGKKKDNFLLQDRSPGGCGIIAGSANLLLYRSGTLGYFDLLRNSGTENYGGIRPGCWINVIPAGGLVLMPDATDRCTCSYLIKASIALQPYGIWPVPPENNGSH